MARLIDRLGGGRMVEGRADPVDGAPSAFTDEKAGPARASSRMGDELMAETIGLCPRTAHAAVDFASEVKRHCGDAWRTERKRGPGMTALHAFTVFAAHDGETPSTPQAAPTAERARRAMPEAEPLAPVIDTEQGGYFFSLEACRSKKLAACHAHRLAAALALARYFPLSGGRYVRRTTPIGGQGEVAPEVTAALNVSAGSQHVTPAMSFQSIPILSHPFRLGPSNSTPRCIHLDVRNNRIKSVRTRMPANCACATRIGEPSACAGKIPPSRRGRQAQLNTAMIHGIPVAATSPSLFSPARQ